MTGPSVATETQAGSPLQRRISLRSAVALVIANIIGAGIFTTTGFQAADLGHPGYIFGLWVVGGILALLGALCYAELGAMMPHAGAEYVYLRDSYGPALGFMSAFVSLVAGFSAPIAAATQGFVIYLSHFVPALAEGAPVFLGVTRLDVAALVVVWLLVLAHARAVRVGVGLVDWMTLFKVTGIVAILLAALAVGRGDPGNFVTVAPQVASMPTGELLGALGTSLIFVMFCFSGWNAAAYVAGEMTHPQRDLPRALLVGTVTVLALYLGLNAVYLYGADVTEIAGKPDVGAVAAEQLFGAWGVYLVTGVLCISILASATAMTMAGPRVYFALGRDYLPFRFLGRTTAGGAPVAALLVQGVVTSGILLSGTIDQIQQYAGFTLSLFASLAVSCVIVLRIRFPDAHRPFRTWGYPWSPLLFIGVSVWMMFWAFQGRPRESSLALFTVVAGGLLFAVTVHGRYPAPRPDFD